MATVIHTNRTGLAIAQFDGLAKDPSWSVDQPSMFTAVGQESGPADRFTALLTPGTQLGETAVRLTVNKLDGSGTIQAAASAEVVEGPATAVQSMIIVEN